MSKIIKAINTMISNSSKISTVIPDEEGNEYFFLYDKKYKWSVKMDVNNVCNVYYYKTGYTLKELACFSVAEWKNLAGQFMTYSSGELKTTESLESMKELYRIVKEKVLGMDDILDDIIGGDDSDILPV